MSLHRPLASAAWKLFTPFLLLLILSGCAASRPQGTSPAPSPTDPPTQQPTPSATASPTATASSPSSTTTVLKKPTATPSIIPTLKSLPLPTITGILDSADYILSTPSPKELLDQLKIAADLKGFSVKLDMNQRELPFIEAAEKDADDALDLLDLEIVHRYPNGLSDKSLIWDYYPIDFMFGPIPHPAYLDLLTDGLYERIVQGQVKLNDPPTLSGSYTLDDRDKNKKMGPYTFQVTQVELDHDPGPEWLVLITWDNEAQTWLVLDEPSPGVYTRLHTDLPAVNFGADDNTIELEADVTGDQLSDVIYLDYMYMMGTDAGTFTIAQGSPDGFQVIDRAHQSIPGYLSEGLLYSIKKPPEAASVSLTLNNPNAIDWDCNWDTVETHRWPGGKPQITIQGGKAPQTPDCFLAQAVSVTHPPDRKTAIKLLEQALPGFPAQSPKSLFAHYRLSVLYAMEGSQPQAHQHFQWFVDHYQQSASFRSSVLEPLTKEPVLNPLQICDLFLGLSNDVYDTIPEGWRKYISANGALNAYPSSPEPYPPAICPLMDPLSEKLAAVHPSPQNAIAPLLEEAGIPVIAENAYVFNPGGAPARFLLVGFRTHFVLGYVPKKDGSITPQIVEEFGPADQLPAVLDEDTTGDGRSELAYSARVSDWRWCKAGEYSTQLFLITSVGPGFTGMQEHVCLPQSSTIAVRDYLKDNDGDGKVDWVMERIRQETASSLLTTPRFSALTWFSADEISAIVQSTSGEAQIAEAKMLTEAFSASPPAQVRKEIGALRDRLPKGDLAAQHTWQKLTYLIAITYEREGLAAEAAAAYLQVLRSEPQTIWWNLALVHLREKP